ncbi:MAG: glycosyltransferase [Anaerolineales bacterium]|nr:glycosyltransferase [Anaerolineales bacterium]
MRVSVILTVLNEGESVRAVLESLAAQTRLPDEVVVCDGGSRDDTLAVLRECARDLARDLAPRLRLKLIEAPGANISQGRNAAIRAASGEIIAVTDAGVRCEPEWLERLLAPFGETDDHRAQTAVVAVAGFFRSDPQTVFEVALGATTLPEAREINPQTYLPSSRSVAFRRSVWEAVGGYPEWLDYCEDVVFDLNVRRRFGPFHFVPEALVHFRPRRSLRAFARQYFQYARGDGKANLFPRQHAVRYFAYLVVAPLLFYAALFVNPWLWLLAAVAGLAYVRLPLRRAWPRLKTLSWHDRLRVLALIPIIRITGDVAKMLGYPVGVWWRLSGQQTRSG